MPSLTTKPPPPSRPPALLIQRHDCPAELLEGQRFNYPDQGPNQKLAGVKPARVIRDLLA